MFFLPTLIGLVSADRILIKAEIFSDSFILPFLFQKNNTAPQGILFFSRIRAMAYSRIQHSHRLLLDIRRNDSVCKSPACGEMAVPFDQCCLSRYVCLICDATFHDHKDCLPADSTTVPGICAHDCLTDNSAFEQYDDPNENEVDCPLCDSTVNNSIFDPELGRFVSERILRCSCTLLFHAACVEKALGARRQLTKNEINNIIKCKPIGRTLKRLTNERVLVVRRMSNAAARKAVIVKQQFQALGLSFK